MKNKTNILFFPKLFGTVQLLLLILSLNQKFYELIAIIEYIFILLLLIEKLGKGIFLREIIAVHLWTTTLIMPIIGYKFFNYENKLARIWVKYMPIPDLQYFEFVLPCALIFITILCYPKNDSNKINNDHGLSIISILGKSISYLKNQNISGVWLIFIGMITHFLINYLPQSLQFIGFIIFSLSFSGAFMMYFNKSTPNRSFYLILFLFFILYISLSAGMFTILIYMGMTVASFIFLGLNWRFINKVAIVVLIFLSVIILQNTKVAYRHIIWGNSGSEENQLLLFGRLLSEQSSQTNNLLNIEGFFPFYTRANQGLNLAYVMKNIPENKNYDNGERLFLIVISSFLPRFIWPDKPMAGGRFNMEYYAGTKVVGSTSMNISPLGEAYGSFGKTGGIIFIACLAYFIRFVYFYFIKLCSKFPLLIFYFPAMFFQTSYSMETDTLQILNSVIKTSIFLFALYMFSPRLFGVEKK